MAEYAHVNGEVCPLSEATVSVRDRGFRYGDGIFETLRVYGGTIFAWEEHYDRLSHSADVLALEHGLDDATLEHRIHETLDVNGLENAYVRLSITRGVQPGKLTPQSPVDPTVVILVDALPRGGVTGEPVWDAPATLQITDVQRVPNAAIPATAKTHNYLNGILARLDEPAADDAILLDSRGAITEGTVSNLFIVDDGVLHTPNTDVGPILPGITRSTVLALAEQADIETRHTVLYPQHLYAADEVFLTNTTAEIRPVTAVDETTYSVGTVTDRLMEAFDHYIEANCYST